MRFLNDRGFIYQIHWDCCQTNWTVPKLLWRQMPRWKENRLLWHWYLFLRHNCTSRCWWRFSRITKVGKNNWKIVWISVMKPFWQIFWWIWLFEMVSILFSKKRFCFLNFKLFLLSFNHHFFIICYHLKWTNLFRQNKQTLNHFYHFFGL